MTAVAYAAEETTISSDEVISTEELVKSRLPDANSLFLILIVEVCAPLEQDPNEDEIVDEGSQSTVALADIVVYEFVNDPLVEEVLYLHVIASPCDTECVRVSELSAATDWFVALLVQLLPPSVE